MNSSIREHLDIILSEIDAEQIESSMETQEVMRRLLGQTGLSSTAEVVKDPLQQNSIIDYNNLEQRITQVNSLWSIVCYRPIYSSRRYVGKVIVLCKRVIRKLTKFLLEPIVGQQTQFNAATANAFNAVRNNDIALSAYIEKLLVENQTANEKIERLEQEITQKVTQINNQEVEYQKRISQIEQTLSEYITKAEKDTEDIYCSLNYADFENYFRGSEAEVKKRHCQYIPEFQGCRHVLDLGSGRGEFLELMRENGIYAEGVDLYDEFVEHARKKGLAVTYGDATEYLCKEPENSYDGIFAGQLVEHLTVQQLQTLCTESYRVLRSGGRLIIETPNPTCVSTYLNSFYMDPSHVKPVHPKTLEYYLKETGFRSVRIKFTESSRVPYRLPLLNVEGANLDEFNDGINALSDVIFGCQDYAVIAEK